jgi:hypothetical protein
MSELTPIKRRNDASFGWAWPTPPSYQHLYRELASATDGVFSSLRLDPVSRGIAFSSLLI